MRNFLLIALAVVVVGVTVSDACSCQPAHPQTTYCNSEYAIIAKVIRKSHYNNQIVYKIIIKKEYKMSNKARKELSKGRLFTAKYDSMCGVDLKVGVPYIMMGNSARITLCNFIKEYSEATIVERRGIGGAYKKGCACDVMPCWREGACEQEEGECLWNPWNECQTQFGSCIPSRGVFNAEGRPTKCRWRKSSPFLNCVKKSLNHV